MADQLAESLQNPNVINVVEWSDIVQNVLPAERLSIKLEPTDNNSEERKITFNYSEKFADKIQAVETEWVEIHL